MEAIHYLQLDTTASTTARAPPSAFSLLPSPTDFALANLPFKAVTTAWQLDQQVHSPAPSTVDDNGSSSPGYCSDRASSPATSHLATPVGSPTQLARTLDDVQAHHLVDHAQFFYTHLQQPHASKPLCDNSFEAVVSAAQHPLDQAYPVYSVQQHAYQAYPLPSQQHHLHQQVQQQHPLGTVAQQPAAAHHLRIPAVPSLCHQIPPLGQTYPSAPLVEQQQLSSTMYAAATAAPVTSMPISMPMVPMPIFAAPSFETPQGTYYFVPKVETAPAVTAPDVKKAIVQSGPGRKRKQGKNQLKRFVCPHPDCGRAFARNFNMQSHLKSHLGIRDFDCPHCPKKFSRRHDRARHCAAVHDSHVFDDVNRRASSSTSKIADQVENDEDDDDDGYEDD